MYEVPNGDELREFLKKHNLTGAATASIVGVDARTVRRWTASIEAENRRPIPWSAWQLLQIATGEKSASSLYPMAEEKKKYFDENSHQINSFNQEESQIFIQQNLSSGADKKIVDIDCTWNNEGISINGELALLWPTHFPETGRQWLGPIVAKSFQARAGGNIAHVVSVYDDGEARAVDNFLKNLKVANDIE